MKGIILLLFGILSIQSLFAQQHRMTDRDTLLYYIDHHGGVASVKDSADYILVIMPVDSSSGVKVYPVFHYDTNNKIILTAYSANQHYGRLSYTGPYTTFFKNGKKEAVVNYMNGKQSGKMLQFYPNGNLYSYRNYKDSSITLIECRDSTGNLLTHEGKGQWIKFDDKFKIYEQGNVIDSLETGEWHGQRGDSITFVHNYTAGKITSGIGYLNGKAYPFTKYEIQPQCKVNFGEYLAKNIRYPKVDRDNNIQGKVFVAFVIERNGKVADIKVLRAPDEPLGEEAVRVLKTCPDWSPGIQDGIPVRVMYTVPIDFSLTGR